MFKASQMPVHFSFELNLRTKLVKLIFLGICIAYG